MKKKLILITGIYAAFLTACSDKSSDQTKNMKAGEIAIAMTNDHGEVIGAITEKVTQSGISLARKESKETTLVPAAVDTKGLQYSRELYLINGTADGNKVYLAPKVLVLPGDGTDNSVANPDGTISIPFKVVVLDGLQEKITAPGAIASTLSAPEEMVLSNSEKESLTQALNLRYGASTVLAGMRGCPANLSIAIDNQLFDVTPEAFKVSDYCQMNRPFSVTLRLPKEKANVLMTQLLPSNNATLYMNFALQVPTVIGRVSVSLDRSKFYEALKVQFQNKSLASSVDIKLAVEKLVAQNHLNITMVGSASEMVDRMLPKIIDGFFSRPEELGLNRPSDQACGTGQTCFMLNYTKSIETKNFDIEIDNIAAVRITQLLESHTVLAPSTSVPLVIGPSAQNAGAEYLTNKATEERKIRFVGSSAVRGSMIRIAPLEYVWENHQIVGEYPTASSYSKECTQWIGGGIFGPGYCANYKEVRFVQYSQDRFEWTRIENPLAQEGSMLQQIDVVFQFESGRTVACPLSSLAKANGREAVMFVDNTDYCQLFGSNSDRISNIGFINRINRGDTTYIAGDHVVSQEHPVGPRNTYHNEVYNPEVKLSLELNIDSGLASKSWIDQQRK